VAGGKVKEVAEDATAVHPSWRQASTHVILATGWATNTSFAIRDTVRQNLTDSTQRLGDLVPGGGCYLNECVFVYYDFSFVLLWLYVYM
jgi:hypothetical protein